MDVAVGSSLRWKKGAGHTLHFVIMRVNHAKPSKNSNELTAIKAMVVTDGLFDPRDPVLSFTSDGTEVDVGCRLLLVVVVKLPMLDGLGAGDPFALITKQRFGSQARFGQDSGVLLRYG